MLNAEQLDLLQSLRQHNVRFLVVGLSSAVLQGATVTTQDVDLWIEDLSAPEFSAAVQAVGGFYIAPGLVGTNPPMLGPQKFRLFDLVTHLHGLGAFDDEYTHSSEILLSGVSLRLLPLERIIASKKAAGRDKDKAVLPILESTAAALRRTRG